ncbi:hypothetical protein P12x_004968 [Tundrisphaera lichenicola]|uniref:hypothetical protein n=1 Tax=Tundrisphaera lichenicola TaxID=2029860 RepID=UPI003EB8CD73
MRTAIALVASLALIALTSTDAEAQRGRWRNGNVYTPFGQASMSDLRAAGGDPFAAAEIGQQRMLMQQQQRMLRMQQQYLQQMARQKKNNPGTVGANNTQTRTPSLAATKARGKAKRNRTTAKSAKPVEPGSSPTTGTSSTKSPKSS